MSCLFSNLFPRPHNQIILRARRNHLFESYVNKRPDSAAVLADVNTAMGPFREKAAKEEDPAKKEMLQKIAVCFRTW